MSKLLRCNRCGQEQELREIAKEDNSLVRMSQAITGVGELRGWTQVKLTQFGFPLKPPTIGFDLCEDCREIFAEQFMVGAAVAPITQPLAQVALPHQPMTDCQLVWNPGKGGFLCYHDDPELYHALIIDNAQNVAEGVPEKPVRICSECGCVAHRKFGPCSSTGCECTAGLREKIEQVAEDVITAGAVHAVPQRCSPACSEQHTYRAGCLLENIVSDVPGQITPPACGPECGEINPDGSMTNPHHTYKLGTCLLNKDTIHAVAVVCPVCKEEGSLAGITMHMAEHGYQPDYVNHQWVDMRGYNLEGRLISQQGEDLTEAYSEQEPAHE